MRIPWAVIAVVTLPGVASGITRDEVIDAAAEYCYHEWYCDASNQTASCSASWSTDYTVGYHTGLPYDWGGYKTIAEFEADLAAGYGAGSHASHGILWCTTGVDCSGFVSQVWDTYHNSTSTMSGISTEISSSSLERGDALNKPSSHIVLFAHEMNSGQPVVYEASGSGDKVRLNTTSTWTSAAGYTPIRYDDIADGTPRGTPSNPIEITSFPYQTFDATSGAGSDAWDSYSCAPSTDESGPERVYRLQLSVGGELRVAVTDDAGIDIDIHLLNAASSGSCVARDDAFIDQHVSAGTWYIAADTYRSGGGTEYPGAYYLDVDFTADGSGDDDDATGDDDDDAAGDDDDDAAGDDDDAAPPSDIPPPWARQDDGGGAGCSCDAPGRTPAAPGTAAAAWFLGLAAAATARRRLLSGPR